MFSLLMPVVAWAPTLVAFVIARILVNFALNGEWALGSLLVAETWPAHLRGRVLSINRGTWCFGVATAGLITAYIMAEFGWRWAIGIPGIIALLAIYVRAKCPESPYPGADAGPQDAHRRRPRRRAAGERGGRGLVAEGGEAGDRAAVRAGPAALDLGRDLRRLLQRRPSTARSAAGWPTTSTPK
jgi:MFS family permease